MQGEAEPQFRAWVEYFRDLGVYDFYRRGEFVPEAGRMKPSRWRRRPKRLLLFYRSVAAVAEPESDEAYPDDAIPAEHFSAASPSVTPAVPQLVKLVSFDNLAPMPAAKVPVVERAAALHAIQEEIGDCTRCPLAYAGRHKIVFGDG